MTPFQWPPIYILRRHPVAFGTRVPGKSESVYYNLQFWLFLRHFWPSPGLIIFSPETFIGVPTWLVMLRRCLAQFALPQKSSQHTICSFLVKLKLKLSRNGHKGIHIFVPSHKTPFQWPSMSLGGYPWHSELGPRESPKACIITFNFGCFCDIFILLRTWSYFLPKYS